MLDIITLAGWLVGPIVLAVVSVILLDKALNGRFNLPIKIIFGILSLAGIVAVTYLALFHTRISTIIGCVILLIGLAIIHTHAPPSNE